MLAVSQIESLDVTVGAKVAFAYALLRCSRPSMTSSMRGYRAWLAPRAMAPPMSCRYAVVSQKDLHWCQSGAILEPWNLPRTLKASAAS